MGPARAQPAPTVTVDLESRTVKAGEGVDAIEDSFDIDDYTRWRLLEGLDDIGITLSHEDDIAVYEPGRPASNPPRCKGFGPSEARNPMF